MYIKCARVKCNNAARLCQTNRSFVPERYRTRKFYSTRLTYIIFVCVKFEDGPSDTVLHKSAATSHFARPSRNGITPPPNLLSLMRSRDATCRILFHPFVTLVVFERINCTYFDEDLANETAAVSPRKVSRNNKAALYKSLAPFV